MNHTIKDATVKRYVGARLHDQAASHTLQNFVDAYNFARRLKTLRGLTPYEFICKAWISESIQIQNQPAPANAGTKHLDRGKPRDEDTEGGSQPADKSSDQPSSLAPLPALRSHALKERPPRDGNTRFPRGALAKVSSEHAVANPLI